MQDAFNLADEARQSLGFMSIGDTAALNGRGIVVVDPFSTLVSPDVQIGIGSVLWPGVILQCSGGRLSVGADTKLHAGTRLVSHGEITIGDGVELGEEGGFTIKAERGSTIFVGADARLLGGGSLTLSNRIGDGAQIIGPIRCQNCTLGSGGGYREQDPDLRGGVLKGSGVARNIDVPQGHVIQAFGIFADGVMRRQTYFHPKA